LTKEQVLSQLGLTEAELEDKTTALALAYSQATLDSNLNPLVAVDAVLRFSSSLIDSLGMLSGNTEYLADQFAQGFRTYVNSILSNQDEILADAPAEVQAVAASRGVNINPKGYAA